MSKRYKLTCWMDTGAGAESGWAFSLYDGARTDDEGRPDCIAEGPVGQPGRDRPEPSVRAVKRAAGYTGRRDVDVVIGETR